MFTYRTVLSLILLGVCGAAIGILGQISGFYGPLAFLAFPFTIVLLCWSILYDLRHSPLNTTVRAEPPPHAVAVESVRAHRSKAA
jgi:hypothetical protein